jgi:uncharacterized protein YkwD
MLGTTGVSKVKRLAATALAVLVVSFGLALTSAPSANAWSNDDQSLFDLTNQSRAQNGLGALQYDAALSSVARGWVSQMAGAGVLSHNGNLASQVGSQVTNDWTRIGENVGFGSTTTGLEAAFMNSPGHRANILGDYNRVGIATQRDASGTLWVVVDFVKGPALDTAPPSVAAPAGSTIGNLDSAWRQPGSIGIFGWAIDPDTTASIPVHVYVDGVFAALGTANVGRPDIAAAYPNYGANHGYQITVPVSGGMHQICAYGINSAGGGTNTQLRCTTVYVADSPMGSLDVVRSLTGAVQVKGWSVDPDTAAFTKVHFYIDGRWAAMTDANAPRADIGSMLPAYGNNHGYDTYMAVASGNHAVCAYGINAAGTGTNTLLGCRYFVINGDPRGNLDVATSPQAGRLRVAGWAFDPDAPLATTTVHVYVDGAFGGIFQANKVRNDIGAAFPGVGNNHGYDMTLSLARGTHNVCTYAINAAGAGSNPMLGCRTVNVG